MDSRQLRQLLRTLQEFGVTSYKTPDIELQLEAVRPQASSADGATVPQERDLTPEELLFYSTQPMPDSQAGDVPPTDQ